MLRWRRISSRFTPPRKAFHSPMVKVRTTPVGFFVAYGDGVVDDRDLDAVRAGAEAALAPLSLREVKAWLHARLSW
jgi:hypothetical protein